MNDKVKKDNADQKSLKLKKNEQKTPENLTYAYVQREKPPPPSNNFYPDKNHIKALHEACAPIIPFYCVYCKKMCEQEDHYQLNEWWIMQNIV